MRTHKQQFYYKNNRLQQLRGFCHAAQFGNISRAAKHLGLTQSSVSVQIKALEDDLGCTLFTRHGPRIKLTAEGEKLLEMALPLVDGIQNLYEEFHTEVKAQVRTELRIAVNNTVKNYLLPPVVNDYLQANPEIRVVLHYAEHDEAMRLIQQDEVDIAVLPRREHMPFPKAFEYQPVFFCKPCLITLKDHPLAGRKNLQVSEIKRYPLTLPAKDLRVIPNLYEVFGPLKRENQLRIGFVDSETGREYVETGFVITISSDVWVRKHDILAATPLSHLFSDIDYGVVRKRSATIPPKVKLFIDVAQIHALKRLGNK